MRRPQLNNRQEPDRVIEFLKEDDPTLTQSSNVRALKKPEGGRVAAYEIMVGTPAIRNLIREAKVPQIYGMIQTGRDAGMVTMDQSLDDLVSRNLVTRETARTLAVDQSKFE